MSFLQACHHHIMKHVKTLSLDIWFYLYGIALYSLVFAFITYPPHGMDEGMHFFRALQISQGEFFPTRYPDHTLGGELDTRMVYYTSTMFFNADKTSFAEKQHYVQNLNTLPADQMTRTSFTPSASYSPVMYVPSATGLFLARIFHGNADTRYFSGRLANIICYVFLLALILMILPTGRYVILLFLSTPASLQIAASYNADTFANLMAILFITCCLKTCGSAPLSFHKWKYVLPALTFLLGLLKITYCFLSLFCLLIPATLFRNKRNHLLFCMMVILSSVIPSILWNSLYPFNPGQYFHHHDNPAQAFHILITHPIQVIKLICHTLYLYAHSWYLEFYGRLVNNHKFFQDIFFINRFSDTFLIFPLLTILMEKKNKPSLQTALSCFTIGTGYGVLILLAFYLDYSPIGSDIIMGLQGRYFILSIIPILLGMFYCLPQKLSYEKALPAILIINFFCLTHNSIHAFRIIANSS